MKKLLVIFTVLTVFVSFGCKKKCDCKNEKAKDAQNATKKVDVPGKINLKTDDEKFAYFFGYNTGQNFTKTGIKLDPKLVMAGLNASVKGTKSLVNEAEGKKIFRAFMMKAMKARMGKNGKMGNKPPVDMKLAKANEAKGKAFLDKNKSVKGVKALPDGLQYQVIKEGKGANPKVTDSVECHYKGTLLNGTVFDSSYKRNKPSKFSLMRVIKGWKEGIPLMKVGSKYKFWIPGNLAYGLMPPRGSKIGPNEMLIFEVELLSIVTAPKGAIAKKVIKTPVKVTKKVVKKAAMK